jgi:hypothetical protein
LRGDLSGMRGSLLAIPGQFDHIKVAVVVSKGYKPLHIK